MDDVKVRGGKYNEIRVEAYALLNPTVRFRSVDVFSR